MQNIKSNTNKIFLLFTTASLLKLSWLSVVCFLISSHSGPQMRGPVCIESFSVSTWFPSTWRAFWEYLQKKMQIGVLSLCEYVTLHYIFFGLLIFWPVDVWVTCIVPWLILFSLYFVIFCLYWYNTISSENKHFFAIFQNFFKFPVFPLRCFNARIWNVHNNWWMAIPLIAFIQLFHQVGESPLVISSRDFLLLPQL